jgi:hypothetical protein
MGKPERQSSDEKPTRVIVIPPDPGLMDPRDLVPKPGDPLAGIGVPLEAEPLPGPTEASENTPLPEEQNPTGLVDPRNLAPKENGTGSGMSSS